MLLHKGDNCSYQMRLLTGWGELPTIWYSHAAALISWSTESKTCWIITIMKLNLERHFFLTCFSYPTHSTAHISCNNMAQLPAKGSSSTLRSTTGTEYESRNRQAALWMFSHHLPICLITAHCSMSAGISLRKVLRSDVDQHKIFDYLPHESK